MEAYENLNSLKEFKIQKYKEFKRRKIDFESIENTSLKNSNKGVWQSGYINNLTTIKKLGDNYKLCTIYGYSKQSGFDSNRKFSKKSSVNEKKLTNNLIRAKTKIREYALCNDFEYFVTLTLDKKKYNRYDLDKYIKDLSQFIRDYRKKTKCDFQYILIPENHEDGAWHLHGLVMGLNPNDLELFDNIKNAPSKLKNKGYYNFEAYQKKFGFCSFGIIKNKEKVANYIVKYVNKNLGDNIDLNNKVYYNSRGLKKPQLIKKGLLQSPLKYDFENEYCGISTFKNIDNIIIDEFL